MLYFQTERDALALSFVPHQILQTAVVDQTGEPPEVDF